MSSLQCNRGSHLKVHLKTMSDGRNHPAAMCPTIHYLEIGEDIEYEPLISMTSSRLIATLELCGTGESGCHIIIIWDWNCGQVLFVGQLFTLLGNQSSSTHRSFTGGTTILLDLSTNIGY